MCFLRKWEPLRPALRLKNKKEEKDLLRIGRNKHPLTTKLAIILMIGVIIQTMTPSVQAQVSRITDPVNALMCDITTVTGPIGSENIVLYTFMMDENNIHGDNCEDGPWQGSDLVYRLDYDPTQNEWSIMRVAFYWHPVESWWIVEDTEARFETAISSPDGGFGINIWIPLTELGDLTETLPWKVRTQSGTGSATIGDLAPDEGLTTVSQLIDPERDLIYLFTGQPIPETEYEGYVDVIEVTVERTNDLIYISTREPVPPEQYVPYVDVIEVTVERTNELSCQITTVRGPPTNLEDIVSYSFMFDKNNWAHDNCPNYPTEGVDTKYTLIYTPEEWRIVRERWYPGENLWMGLDTQAQFAMASSFPGVFSIEIRIPLTELRDLHAILPWKVETETLIESYLIGDLAPDEGFDRLLLYDYVIITTNDIVANSAILEDFIRLKERLGHSVRVVTETDFDGLTGQPPNGRAEKMRQWLINNQASLGIQYVLLIGNPDPDDPTNPSDPVGDIPMKMCWPGFEVWYWDREYPTDFFYADLDGNWNLDGDLYYGEWTSINNPTKPDELLDDDTFSIRWTGKINIQYTQMYTFSIFSDDGVRLWIDSELIINHWASHPPALYTAYKDFSRTGLHDIRLDFHEHTGDAIVNFLWACTPHFRTCNPQNNDLYYDDGTGVFRPGGLNGLYYENEDFTSFRGRGMDNIVRFYWLTGDRGSGGVDFEAEVFVGRIPVYDHDYAQLDHILQKMISYETELGDRSWRKRILLPTYPSDSSTPGWELHEAIKTNIADPTDFMSCRVYSANDGVQPPPCEITPCTEQNVENEWRNGYGMVAWFTHGTSTTASNVFAVGQCTSLDDTKPSFTFQGSCMNAWPEDENNLAYSLLKHGAISTVAATRISMYNGSGWFSPCPDQGYTQDLVYYYTWNIIQDENTAGEALFKAKNLNEDQSNDLWRNVLAYNLYGDPACSLIEPLITDLDRNRNINIVDLTSVALAFHTEYDEANGMCVHAIPCNNCPHHPCCDINGDDVVNIIDIYMVAIDFGETY